MITRETGLRELGVPQAAGAREIQRAYKTRSRALKTLMLRSTRSHLKEARRQELRRLVVSRAVALGESPPMTWAAGTRAASKRFLTRLGAIDVLKLDAAKARRHFGLASASERSDILDAYRGHMRALIRRFAQARDDQELKQIRNARMKLRTLRNFALS